MGVALDRHGVLPAEQVVVEPVAGGENVAVDRCELFENRPTMTVPSGDRLQRDIRPSTVVTPISQVGSESRLLPQTPVPLVVDQQVELTGCLEPFCLARIGIACQGDHRQTPQAQHEQPAGPSRNRHHLPPHLLDTHRPGLSNGQSVRLNTISPTRQPPAQPGGPLPGDLS